jgi:hypothetical protein
MNAVFLKRIPLQSPIIFLLQMVWLSSDLDLPHDLSYQANNLPYYLQASYISSFRYKMVRWHSISNVHITFLQHGVFG